LNVHKDAGSKGAYTKEKIFSLLFNMKKFYEKHRNKEVADYIIERYRHLPLKELKIKPDNFEMFVDGLQKKRKIKILMHSINGIGLGHLNRTTIIAKEILKQSPQTRMRFVTNAKFSHFLDKNNFNYIKTPLTYKDFLEGKISLQEYDSSLNKSILETTSSFRPDIIVFDTHFNTDILEYCSLNNIKAALIYRKQDNKSLNRLLDEEIFDRFDLVMLPHTLDELKELNTPANALDYFTNNAQVKIMGPLIRELDSKKIVQLKKKYKIQAKDKVIVATAGGGGQPGAETFIQPIERAYNDTNAKVKHLKFIFILGPYSNVNITEKGIITKDFEPDLLELLSLSDLAITQAGYNIVNEILFTNTKAIVLPRERATESQFERAESLKKYDFIKVMENPSPGALSKSVVQMLSKKPSKTYKKPKPGNEKAAREILDLLK
jgi:predicted glycosyltransferase